jgi:hypothetical protein
MRTHSIEAVGKKQKPAASCPLITLHYLTKTNAKITKESKWRSAPLLVFAAP